MFGAQTINGLWSLVSYWIIILSNAYRVVVVTDRRIIVCKSGRFRITPVNDIVNELPRSTQIGPAKGIWYKTEALGERIYVAKRFHKDIAAADAAMPAA